MSDTKERTPVTLDFMKIIEGAGEREHMACGNCYPGDQRVGEVVPMLCGRLDVLEAGILDAPPPNACETCALAFREELPCSPSCEWGDQGEEAGPWK